MQKSPIRITSKKHYEKGSPFAINYDEWQEKYKQTDAERGIEEALQAFKGTSTGFSNPGAGGIKVGGFSLGARKFTNEFRNFENQYADLEKVNINNAYEDITINQKAAEFMKQQQMQQQSNIMSGLQAAAGGSGIAALAQTMAQQGQMQAQAASADIGRQERENKLRAAGAEIDISRMQEQRRELVARGGMETQMARMQGAQAAAQMTSQREQAIAEGKLQAGVAQANVNMQANAMAAQAQADARNLEFEKSQALLAFYSGQKEADEMNKMADKSWWERTFG